MALDKFIGGSLTIILKISMEILGGAEAVPDLFQLTRIGIVFMLINLLGHLLLMIDVIMKLTIYYMIISTRRLTSNGHLY